MEISKNTNYSVILIWLQIDIYGQTRLYNIVTDKAPFIPIQGKNESGIGSLIEL